MRQDPYEVLGIEPGETSEGIRQAYKRMARRHHPDLNPHRRDAAIRFREVVEAYERLLAGRDGVDEGASEKHARGPRSTRPRSPRPGTARPNPAGRARRTSASTDWTNSSFAGEAAFIVKAHVQGLKVMRNGAVVSGVFAAAFSSVAVGQASMVFVILVGLSASLLGRATGLRAMAAMFALDPHSEAGHLVKESFAIAIGATLAVALVGLVPGSVVSGQAVTGGVIGGMALCYLLGRLWDEDDPVGSLMFGAIVAIPFGTFVAGAIGGFSPTRHYYRLGFDFDMGAAAVFGALVGGGLSATLTLVRRRR